MKHEWRKQEKEQYLPKEEPQLINIESQKFLTIKGQGNPNGEDFSERLNVLYSLAYGIRMMPRSGYEPEGYFEYTVYPLEGIWDLTQMGKESTQLDKDEFLYTIMIRQPEFVTEEVVEKARTMVRNKKPHPLLDDIEFENREDGLSLQMLHKGPYEDEHSTFKKMDVFLNDNGYKRKTKAHKEIYLSDPRKTKKDELKTVLRYFIEKEEPRDWDEIDDLLDDYPYPKWG